MQTASIIDYPREDLPKDIWDNSGDELKLQPTIRDEIEDIVFSFLADVNLPDDALIDVLIYGSILTNQYNKKTDVDARILLDPDVVSQVYPDITGDELFEAARNIVDKIILEPTQHPLNATVVIEGEQTELGKSELGISENDPVYSFKLEELINKGTKTPEDFDPDEEFEQERSEVADIMTVLDNIIQETKADAIDYEMIDDAVKDVKNPEKLISKLEEKLKEIEADLEQATDAYTKLKDERSEGYKQTTDENRHKAPGNVRYKMLEKYKYMDVLKKLKRILNDGVSEKEVDDVAEALQVSGQNTQEVPPVSPTGPAAPVDPNPMSYNDGGMMHGASCPKCGFINPITAAGSKEIACMNCGHKFANTNYHSSPAPSTRNESAPYPSDVKIGEQVDVDEISTLLNEFGIAQNIIDQVKQRMQSPTNTQKPVQSPQAPNAPKSPNAPDSSKSEAAPQQGLKPGIQMKQLGAREFIAAVQPFTEYKCIATDDYAVILEEMSEGDKYPYRVFHFDSVGPRSHFFANSIEDAANQIWKDLGPNIEKASGVLDRLALSDQWIAILPKLLEVQRHNQRRAQEGHAVLNSNSIIARARLLMKRKAWFDEPSNTEPGGSPYPDDMSLAEAKKEKKKDDKKKPDDPAVMEVVTVLEGIDILPYIEDIELFEELIKAFGLPTLEKAALYMEPAEGKGQFSPVVDTPDYTAKTPKKLNKNKDECPIGGPGKGKGKGRGLGEHRKAQVDFNPANEASEDVDILEEVKVLGEELGIDWETSPFDVDQFAKGIEVEFEHGSQDPETDVTGDDIIETAKIAWAHLKELSDYYDRLEKMETEGDQEEPTDEGEDPLNKIGAAYMTTCPNCGTIQRVDFYEPTRCPNCTFPIPPYSELQLDDDEAVPAEVTEKPKPKHEVVTAKRLEESLKSKINKELTNRGLDGNGRFEKPGHGLTELANVLDQYNLQLAGHPGGDYQLGTADTGQMHILLETKETETNPSEEIDNSSVSFSWYKLKDYVFECLAYLG